MYTWRWIPKPKGIHEQAKKGSEAVNGGLPAGSLSWRRTLAYPVGWYLWWMPSQTWLLSICESGATVPNLHVLPFSLTWPICSLTARMNSHSDFSHRPALVLSDSDDEVRILPGLYYQGQELDY
jgi:hypothetical protein